MKKSFSYFMLFVFMLVLQNNYLAQAKGDLTGKWDLKNNAGKKEHSYTFNFKAGGTLEIIKKMNNDLSVQNGSWKVKGDSLTLIYYKGTARKQEAKKDTVKLYYSETNKPVVEKTIRYAYKLEKNQLKMKKGKEEIILVPQK